MCHQGIPGTANGSFNDSAFHFEISPSIVVYATPLYNVINNLHNNDVLNQIASEHYNFIIEQYENI